MSDIVFSIARDFSVNPGPRYKRQGKFSGEELRPRLIELLDSAKGKIVVILDGTKGMGSSFLDEAFGGLIAKEGRERMIEHIRDRLFHSPQETGSRQRIQWKECFFNQRYERVE